MATLPYLVVVLAIVGVACGGAASAGSGDGAGAPARGDPVPLRSFELFDGSRATLASFAGTPTVVNFWASWCPSCVAEMSTAFKPVVEQVGDQVAFVGMNIQDDRQLALGLLEEAGVNWISAEDPAGQLYVDLGGLGMPFTVFISSGGEIVDKHNGPLSQDQLRNRIAEVFGV